MVNFKIFHPAIATFTGTKVSAQDRKKQLLK